MSEGKGEDRGPCSWFVIREGGGLEVKIVDRVFVNRDSWDENISLLV